MEKLKIIYCGKEYAGSILEILNEAILNSTALYEYLPRDNQMIDNWFDIKIKNNFPIIGIIDEHANLLGFGTYATFRPFVAFSRSIEHSIYIHKNYRGQGLGKKLLAELIKNAIKQNYHCMIAGIDSKNIASIQLHKQFCFEFSGRIKQVGYKFSDWLDLDFYQLIVPNSN